MWLRRMAFRRVRLREIWITMAMILGFYVLICFQFVQLKDAFPSQTKHQQHFSGNSDQSENGSLTSDSVRFGRQTVTHEKLVRVWKQVTSEWKRLNSIKSVCLWSYAHPNQLRVYEETLHNQRLKVHLNANSLDLFTNCIIYNDTFAFFNPKMVRQWVWPDCERLLWLDQAESSQLAFALPPEVPNNRIEPIGRLFANRAVFCTLVSSAYRDYVELNALPRFSIGCFLLPRQLNCFREAAIALGPQVNWLFRRANHRLTAADEMMQLLGQHLMETAHEVPATIRSRSNWSKREDERHKRSSTGGQHLGQGKEKDQNDRRSGRRRRSKKSFGRNTFAVELVEQRDGSVLRHSRGIKAIELIRKLDLSQYERYRVNESIVFLHKTNSTGSEQPSYLEKQSNSIDDQATNSNNQHWLDIQLPHVVRLFSEQGRRLLQQMEKASMPDWNDPQNTHQDIKSDLAAVFDSYSTTSNRNQVLVERLIDRQLQVNGHLIQLHVPMLITRLNPLQAFRYAEAIVLFRKAGAFNHSNSINQSSYESTFATKFWTQHELFDYVRQVFGESSAERMQTQLELTLNRFVLISEFLALNDHHIRTSSLFPTAASSSSDRPIRSSNHVLQSYQLIDVELVCTQQFQFYVTDVTLEANYFERVWRLVSNFAPTYQRNWRLWQQSLLSNIWPLLWHSKRSAARTKRNEMSSWPEPNSSGRKKCLKKRSSKGKTKRSVHLSSTSESSEGQDEAETLRLTGALDEALEQHELGLIGLNCQIAHRACLGERDLFDLAASIQQQIKAKSHRWQSVYPSGRHVESQSQLLGALIRLWSERDSIRFDSDSYRTGQMHSLRIDLQIKLVRSLAPMDAPGDTHNELSDLKVNSKEVRDNLIETGLLASYDESDSVPYDESPSTHTTPDQQSPGSLSNLTTFTNCSHSVHQFASISSTVTFLNGDVWTVNSSDSSLPQNLHYQVPFAVLNANVSVTSRHCDCDVMFEQLQGKQLQFRVNLGIGSNHIRLRRHCWSNSAANSLDINLIVNRESIDSRLNFESDRPYEVCEQMQDCDFKVYPNSECGLKQVKRLPAGERHFDSYIESWQGNRSGLCDGRIEEAGRWVMPCNQCSNQYTCNSKQRRWLPFKCRLRSFDREQLDQCLQNTRIWFLGDSTNRGIMHSLIQQLNGSLFSGEKTHSIKFYNRLGLSRSVEVAFAYYPQFWLHDQSPTLDQILQQMIQIDGHVPSSDHKRTVLVVGGVQWMSTHHLDQILSTLVYHRLQDALVVVKTLGAGFHQPIQGVHYLPLEMQQKLAQHNQKLIRECVQRDIRILDTFNMTSFAYREFFPGKCSCHFHQLEQMSDGQFEVKGQINLAYTNALINVICNQKKFDHL